MVVSLCKTLYSRSVFGRLTIFTRISSKEISYENASSVRPRRGDHDVDRSFSTLAQDIVPEDAKLETLFTGGMVLSEGVAVAPDG